MVLNPGDLFEWQYWFSVSVYVNTIWQMKVGSLINHYNMWDENIYLFSNFNGATDEAWELISNFIKHFTGYVHDPDVQILYHVYV